MSTETGQVQWLFLRGFRVSMGGCQRERDSNPREVTPQISTSLIGMEMWAP